MCYTLGTSNSCIMGLKGSPQIRFLGLYKSVFEEYKVKGYFLVLYCTSVNTLWWSKLNAFHFCLSFWKVVFDNILLDAGVKDTTPCKSGVIRIPHLLNLEVGSTPINVA